jgi:hypothetical protein
VSGHWVSFFTLVISCALNIASAAVVSRSYALVVLRVSSRRHRYAPNFQLAFLYASILIEAMVTSIQVYRGSHVKGPTIAIADRYGQFALIIL